MKKINFLLLSLMVGGFLGAAEEPELGAEKVAVESVVVEVPQVEVEQKNVVKVSSVRKICEAAAAKVVHEVATQSKALVDEVVVEQVVPEAVVEQVVVEPVVVEQEVVQAVNIREESAVEVVVENTSTFCYKNLREQAEVKEALVVYVSKGRPLQQSLQQLALETMTKDLEKLSQKYEVYICPSTYQEMSWAAMQWPYYRIMLRPSGTTLESARQMVSSLLKVGHKKVSLVLNAESFFPSDYIESSFSMLNQSDIVFGPLAKGGLYLISANRELPRMRNISFGGSSVLEECLKVTKRYKITTGALPQWKEPTTNGELREVALSLPEKSDVSHLINRWLTNHGELSIIIPVKNEGAYIERVVDEMRLLEPAPEVIFVDRGSSDDTILILRALGERVICLEEGAYRADAFNKGVEAASGDYLLFLHADSHLRQVAYAKMLEELESGRIEAGTFRFKVERERRNGILSALEKGVAFRGKCFKMAYGDQGYFVTKKAFDRIGPYKAMPVMEDVEWFGRMKQEVAYSILEESLESSARRMYENGIVRNSLRNYCVLSLYKLGVKPEKLAKLAGR